MSSAERRAVAAQARLDVELAGRPVVTPDPSDPYCVAWLGTLRAESADPREEYGIVIDAVPVACAYLVDAGPRGNLWCTLGATDSSFANSGVRPTDTLPLLTRVRFVRHPDSPIHGVITGADPHFCVHTGNQPAEPVWPFVRSGYYVESAHRTRMAVTEAVAALGDVPLLGSEAADWSAGRPYDLTTAGEWGRRTELGLGFFLDPFQVQLRVDEATGVFGFYDDSLLRVCGHNLQVYSSQAEREDLEDEGEFYGHTRRTVYPWEAYGLYRPNQVTPGWQDGAAANNGLAAGQGTRLTDPAAVQAGSGFGPAEPELLGQITAARLLDWTGYLGQAGHNGIVLPVQLPWAYPSVPAGALSATVDATDSLDGEFLPAGRLTVNDVPGPMTQPFAVPPAALGGPAAPGVYEEHRTLPGGYHLRTARRVVIAKRASIPQPRPLRRPEDPSGDSPTSGYAPSGLSGGAAAHAVDADPFAAIDPGRRMTLLPDAVAYLFNWENLHPFVYHESDWAVPEEGVAGAALVNQQAPDYALLATEEYLAAPAPVFLDVDHRYGTAPYYETEAIWAILDDGSIVFRDGWGSEIRMGGGHIELRAAGDLRVYTGRGVLVWAGDDFVVKAHKSIDLTASHGDMRTSAYFNNHHLAGNSGLGGFLFESKAECPAMDFTGKWGEDVGSSGFTILCPTSQVAVIGAEVRMALDTSAPTDARITLDAGQSRAVHVLAKRAVTRIRPGGSQIAIFDDGAANESTGTYNLFSKPVLVDDNVLINGCLSTTVGVQTNGGFTSGTDVDGTDLVARANYLKGSYLAGFQGQAGAAPGTEDAEFSLRSTLQYGATAFVFWRSHWEAVADADGQTLTPWNETPVLTLVSAVDTYPHPGERWTAGGGYAYQSYTLVDGATGWLAVDRTTFRSDYESPSPAATTTGSLADNYVVIVPP